MDPLVGLVRRWAVDWLASRDPSVCPDILAPGYSLLIGGHRLEGRDAYVAATVAQLDRFPGLGITVHEVLSSGDRVALRFTEHGAAERLEGRIAAWGGVALFGWDGARLTRGFAEEDYLSRRRQLESGACDPIEPPAPAPWNTAAQAPDTAAEAVVREWLEHAELTAVDVDDGWLGHDVAVHLEDVTTELDELFSAGGSVAFHGVQRGRYGGGFDGLDAAGEPAVMHLAGVVAVERGAVVRGRVVRDRLGLQRAVAAAVAP